ncbi:heavy metal-responsive transcriptional regulator [Demequina activiva]|uniref:MerR family transcriptional regulator n=1 Tax=Demequina activiva TaxID=1582364 RepID=A0A919UFQ4_9MICO|nr:heavy metal-responsive transcriptional regulator [Demequina activiva]GIG53967.1 MerR family transcriptional regulator [Demequina activiva]
MRIGELARQAGVTAKTVRYYESIGLLADPGRTGSGYREYGEDALERLRFVRDAQAAGLTLKESGTILDMKSEGERTCHHTQELLDRHLADIDAQIASLEAARAELRGLSQRAAALDPAACTDPNRCQVLAHP